MRINELPRLTDDERDALDGGYIAMEGVPALEVSSQVATKPKPVPAPRRFLTIAKIITAIAAAIALSACAMTPTQKRWTGIAAGVLIVGAVAAHQADSGKPAANGGAIGKPSLPCHPQPDGTCR